MKKSKPAVKSAKLKKTMTAKKTTKKVVAKSKTTKKAKTSKSESTHIIAILDRSGSMQQVAKDAIGGYNNFIIDQKKLKDNTTISAVLFDDKYEPMYEGKAISIQDVPELTNETFVPRGSTALFDAIGKSVNEYKLKAKVAKTNTKVLVIIITDGAENASREFTRKDIADLIAYQKTQNWQFIFLCSTEDALNRAQDMNISAGNAFQFTNTSLGNAQMYSKISNASLSYRGMSMDVASISSDSLLSEDEN